MEELDSLLKFLRNHNYDLYKDTLNFGSHASTCDEFGEYKPDLDCVLSHLLALDSMEFNDRAGKYFNDQEDL